MWQYDIWSVGVVWLELLLGSPHVFQASAHSLAHWLQVLHLLLVSKSFPATKPAIAMAIRFCDQLISSTEAELFACAQL